MRAAALGDRLMEFVNGLTHAATFGVLIADQGKGRVMADAQGTAAVLYNLTKEDIALFHKGVVKMGEICWAAGAKRVQPTYLGHHDYASRAEWKRFVAHTPAPGDLALTSYHPLGTCRMGTDPRTSVVDLDHETHDAKGLFLVDGSVVSGPLGVNPQLTIMAVATRAADRIAATLG
ncbi:MAG: GMC family oxidoreductase [Deltaproteobacteria bacterium]